MLSSRALSVLRSLPKFCDMNTVRSPRPAIFARASKICGCQLDSANWKLSNTSVKGSPGRSSASMRAAWSALLRFSAPRSCSRRAQASSTAPICSANHRKLLSGILSTAVYQFTASRLPESSMRTAVVFP